MTIESILDEKRVFDLSLNFERSSLSNDGRGWSETGDCTIIFSFHLIRHALTAKAPSIPYIANLPFSANLLHVSIEAVRETPCGKRRQLLFVSTADRRLSLLDPLHDLALLGSRADIHDSPILSCLVPNPDRMTTITTSMSGQVVLYDNQTGRTLSECRHHKKFVVKVACSHHRGSIWVATAGWDARVFLYRLQSDAFGDPVASISLATIPETVLFLKHPDDAHLILLLTRRDSTFLHYYSFTETDNPSLSFLGQQNLAPHSNAWTTFTPSSISICQTNPHLLAVATSTVPHMKLIIVRLLIPPLQIPLPEAIAGASQPISQASQSRRKLDLEDREDAAIQVHVNTFAPQTPYSTPQVCWRPDGSGVWVNGDDGTLRGLDVETGKICAVLKGGHEPASKIRSIWAGVVEVDGKQEEWVVSGGFDKKLVVWKPSDTANS